jgi:hypothetical protein
MDSFLFPKNKRRKPFKTSTKKKEWNKSAGRSEDDFKTTSKCRVGGCRRTLIWKNGTYDFDHKNNNSKNNSQKNCYLVCKTCHGRHTKLGKKKIIDKFTRITLGYKTIKKKVGYKKQIRKKRKKRKTRHYDPWHIT